MRPRISQREANYLVQLLKVTAPYLEQLKQRHENLRLEMWSLKQRLRTEGYTVFKNEHYSEKKQELAKLDREASDVLRMIAIHKRLIAKYSAIAEGVSHRGTYKHLSLTSNGIMFPHAENIPQILAPQTH